MMNIDNTVITCAMTVKLDDDIRLCRQEKET